MIVSPPGLREVSMNATLSKDANIVKRLLQTNSDLLMEGVISKRQYNVNRKMLAERLVAIMEAEIAEVE